MLEEKKQPAEEVSEKALVFNIVHGSVVDGWGIRTTVFLKGCPLRCQWCCNPESQHRRPELRFQKEHCSGCGRCAAACPEAIHMEDGYPVIDRSKWDGSTAPADACWTGALTIWGAWRTAADVFQECLRDKEFYKESGGGVTLSGGEPTMWPDFCLEMIRRCHAEDISVAIDTCGQITDEKGLEVLHLADLILFDVKGINPMRHQQNTTVSNEIIQKNLRLVNDWNKDVIIRYPVIPNYNQMEAEEIADLLASLRCVRRVDLIPYHNFGAVKYEELDRKYPLQEQPISPEGQEALRELFASKGLNVQIGG